MLKRTFKKLILILIILCGLTVINSAAQTSPTASVPNFAKTQAVSNGENRTNAPDCQADLEVANKRLNKTLDALEKAENLINSLQTENAAANRLNALNDKIIAKKDETIANQQKLIDIYEKDKGTTISFLWGLIKYRKK